jgi:phage terminase small subunit
MRGTLQRCRDDTLPVAGILAFDGTPNPPNWMQNRDALDEWGRLAPLLIANRLLTAGNVNALSNYCQMQGEFVALYRAGKIPTAAHLTAHRRIAGDLGLSTIRAPGAVRKENIFANNIKPRTV